MKRPIEANYFSYVAYTRALEDYCDSLEQPPVNEQEPATNDGWLQTGGLLYRLTDERRPQNRDEISVAMADGSRSIESRTRRAGELLDLIRSSPPQRKPLTRGQIREIEVDVSLNPSFDYITPAEQLCRAIEAAHGIKGEV